jgi:hypothetical protein
VCHVLEEGSEPPKKALKKEPKVKKERATPKPKAKKGKKRKRDPYSDTEEEEWTGQSSSGKLSRCLGSKTSEETQETPGPRT